MNHGEKIAALRKESGMTQAELGRELNVSFQAVSKWERSESSPDFATMSRIAKLFNVPLSYFENDDDREDEQYEDEEEYEEEYEEGDEDEQTEDEQAPKMVGVCTKCGKVVYEGDEYETSPFVKCKACKKREDEAANAAAVAKAAEEKAERERAVRAQYERRAALVHKRNRGLIIAAIIVGIVDIICIIALARDPSDIGYGLLGLAVITLIGYTYLAQVFWNGYIIDLTFFAVKVFGGWGVIFTFDLDGFIFLVVMKIIMWLLKMFIIIVTFLFSFAVALVAAPFMFVPQMRKLMRGEELR